MKVLNIYNLLSITDNLQKMATTYLHKSNIFLTSWKGYYIRYFPAISSITVLSEKNDSLRIVCCATEINTDEEVYAFNIDRPDLSIDGKIVTKSYCVSVKIDDQGNVYLFEKEDGVVVNTFFAKVTSWKEAVECHLVLEDE